MKLAESFGIFGSVGIALRETLLRSNKDPLAGENLELMDADRGSIVIADDGVPLAVREVGPTDAPITAVFVHGYCLRMASWHFQRQALEQEWGSKVRMVFYDQRGHGKSGIPTPESCTIAQLGLDLDAVIRAVAPRGHLMLIGHSMGGMTVLSMARQKPELVRERVVGVGLISTTAAGLAETGLGRSLDNPVVDAFRLAVRTSPGVVQFGRGAAKTLIAPVLRAASYGTRVSPRLVDFSQKMIDDTSVVTIVNFLETLELHDESDALAELLRIPTTVVCGDDDWIIPFDSSVALADALPEAEMVRIRQAGHLVQLEFPDKVNAALVRLGTRAMELRAQRRSGRRGIV
ncbi:alpha/beta fold hydrolase [Rhodococcoides fascians]|uniref:alpha/beta fold hydrolase n=1 Tax=Rhodococcoides fascians TaxID=1828 RepID=UPI000569AB45|nr:alpha/beta hydrolase [Rhodococcus sp. 06-621-2]OZF09219.1 alpha/beta hydrolase [Rhodococcus sp. 15-1154-1]